MIEMRIWSEAALMTAAIGRVSGGYRIQVTYGPSVHFSGQTSTGERIEGEVVTGTDWILLRDDGVAVFDGKITFKATKPGVHIFDADLDGRVNLQPIGWRVPIRDAQGWKLLGASRKTLIVALPIAFETTNVVPPDAAKRIAEAAENGANFVELAQHQFVARGTIDVERGQIVSLDLRVEELLGQRLWPDSAYGKALSKYYEGSHKHFAGLLQLIAEALPLGAGSWMALRPQLLGQDVERALKSLPVGHEDAIKDALARLAQQESPLAAGNLIHNLFARLDRRNEQRAPAPVTN